MTEYKVTVNNRGTERWYLNDKLHRENGPAITYKNGAEFWYREGKIHREDGPAVVYPCGDKYWFLNDKRLTEEEHREQTQPVRELSMEELESILGYKVKIVKDKSND